MWKYTGDKDKAEIILTLIRHGKTIANEEKRYIGRTDQPLSDLGREEIKRIAGQIASPDLVFTSPLIRCEDTAKILFGDKEHIKIPEFAELDFGVFEMKTYSQLCNDENYIKWIDSRGAMQIPEGESREEFIERVMSGYDKLLDYCDEWICAHPDRKPLRVAATVHGGTVMAVRSRVCNEEYFDCMIPNGDYYEICLMKS